MSETQVTTSADKCCKGQQEQASILGVFLNALGWQGGTVYEAITEIERLKQIEKNYKEAIRIMNGGK